METGISKSGKGADKMITPLTEFLNLLAETAEKNCNLESKISLKELKKEGGIYADLGQGFMNTAYFDKSQIKIIPVLFLCRHKNQLTCMEQLERICNYFQRLKKYPQGQAFSWIDTEIAKEPSKIGRDEDGTYHYSCILNCKIFY